jgi:hypothetical protein
MSTHAGRDSVVDLLLESPERIEQGVTVLDARLRLDEQVEVDALLRDLLGSAVVVLVVRGDVAQELARIAAVVAALQRGRYLLQRLYGERGLDTAARPRFALLAPRFPDNTPALLEMLGGVEVSAFEYRIVNSGGRTVLDLGVFHRTRGPAISGAAAAALRETTRPAPARPGVPRVPDPDEPPAEPAGPDSARRWFLRARESIRALSSHVTESQKEGRVLYRVNDELLATLTLDKQGFRLQCGPAENELAVADEESLNRGLNAVFELYFNQLSPDRPTA